MDLEKEQQAQEGNAKPDIEREIIHELIFKFCLLLRSGSPSDDRGDHFIYV